MSRNPRAVIEYGFRLRLPVTAERGFRWATDYTPEDRHLGGLAGHRTVTWLAPSLALLADTAGLLRGRRITKRFLVHLYPGSRSWVSNDIAGPTLHSQFRYRIRPRGRGASELELLGREVRWDRSYPPAELRRRARALRRADLRLWRRYARAMAREPRPPRPV